MLFFIWVKVKNGTEDIQGLTDAFMAENYRRAHANFGDQCDNMVCGCGVGVTRCISSFFTMSCLSMAGCVVYALYHFV